MSLTFQPVKSPKLCDNIGKGLIYGHPIGARFAPPTDVEELRRVAMSLGINVDEEKAIVEKFCERLKSRMVVTPQVPVLPDQPEGGEHSVIVLDSLSLYLEQK